MSEPEAQGHPPNRSLARRRQANAPSGRPISHKVRLTEEEHARLLKLADEQEVTIPRLLVESALASTSGETPTQRRQAMVELFAIRHQLATVANNINQLARIANVSGEVPGGLEPVLLELRGLARRIDDTLDGLAGR